MPACSLRFRLFLLVEPTAYDASAAYGHLDPHTPTDLDADQYGHPNVFRDSDEFRHDYPDLYYYPFIYPNI